MTDRAEWLAGLKVGDPVAVDIWPEKGGTVQRVARFTKQFIVADDGRRFRKRDGFMPGDDPWNLCNIKEPTRAPARKAKARKVGR